MDFDDFFHSTGRLVFINDRIYEIHYVTSEMLSPSEALPENWYNENN